SKLKSSSAPIGREDSWCFHAVGSSNAPLLGSTAAEGLPRIGRTSIATHWRSCGLPQSASCSENFVIPPDVFGQTLKPGGLFTATEYSVGPGGDIIFPVPWAYDASINFLESEDVMRAQYHAAGFRILEWMNYSNNAIEHYERMLSAPPKLT